MPDVWGDAEKRRQRCLARKTEKKINPHSKAHLDMMTKKAAAKARESKKGMTKRITALEKTRKESAGLSLKEIFLAVLRRRGGIEFLDNFVGCVDLAKIVRLKKHRLGHECGPSDAAKKAKRDKQLALEEGLAKEKHKCAYLYLGLMARMLPTASVIEKAEMSTSDTQKVVAEIQRLGGMVELKAVVKDEEEQIYRGA